ncbi:uncharacterized protein LOC131938054 [Physella acuta]|uniref:uncharacterized protein LOC131938054 n=1 Tax=Physella acuta TaxID=109671 RepID=UPI0027DE7848|nr:uncharacterized protein LOC131938054 [Physella acuta]
MTPFIIWSFYFIFQFVTIIGIQIQMNQNNLPVLSYNYDAPRKVYWYCEFGTREIISNEKSQKDFEPECVKLYKVYRYISQDGQEHFPFLRDHSTLGIRLKCAALNILNGKLLDCESDEKQDLHTTCKYTCNDGFTARSPNVTCDLTGQPHNVSAAWSIDHDYCIGNSSFNDPVSTANTMQENITTLVSPLQPNNEDVQKIFLISVIVGSLLIFAVVVVVLFVLKHRKKGSHDDSRKPVNENEEGFPELNSPLYSMYFLSKESDKKLKNKKNSNKDHSHKEPLDDQDLVNLVTASTDTSISTSIEIEEGFAELNLSSMPLLKESDKKLRNENSNKDRSHKEQLDKTLENLLVLATRDDATSLASEFNIDDCSVNSHEEGPTELCTTSVALFNQQTLTYRRELRGELEVIEGRHRCEALVGYITENLKRLGYSSENEIKVEEITYKDRTDEKVTDFFLLRMASYGDTIGMMLEYFHRMEAQNVVDVVLKVHNDCTYCKQFKPDTYKW